MKEDYTEINSVRLFLSSFSRLVFMVEAMYHIYFQVS